MSLLTCQVAGSQSSSFLGPYWTKQSCFVHYFPVFCLAICSVFTWLLIIHLCDLSGDTVCFETLGHLHSFAVTFWNSSSSWLLISCQFLLWIQSHCLIYISTLKFKGYFRILISFPPTIFSPQYLPKQWMVTIPFQLPRSQTLESSLTLFLTYLTSNWSIYTGTSIL